MALRDAFADLLNTPANPAIPAIPAKTRADVGPQPDSAACESLRILRIGCPSSEDFAEFASIRRPEKAEVARANACDSQDSQHSHRHALLMTRDEADRAHWPAWSGAEIDRTVSRVHLFMRRGVAVDHAEHLAERLLLRDREQDDRHLCLECSNLTPSGRCHAAARGHIAGVDPNMQPVPMVLARCEGFTEMIPL